MARRITWQLLIAAAMLVLLAALATLQHRWLGQVSDAERDRLRASLTARASAFADDFDLEITRLYVAFQPGSTRLDDDPAAFLSDAVGRAADAEPALVKDVYVFDPSAGRDRLARLDPARRVLDPAAWPDSLAAVRQRIEPVPPRGPDKASMFLTEAIDPATPAFVIPMPRLRRLPSGGEVAIVPDPLASTRFVIVVLDRERLRHQLIEPLAAKQFGDPARSDYDVTIVIRNDPRHVIYASTPQAAVDGRAADVSLGMFDLRLNDLHYMTAAADSRQTAKLAQFAITIVRRAAGAAGERTLTTGRGQGAWQVLVRGRSGSLETLVAQSRRRNLAISLGVLGLLAGSFVLIIGSAQRQQRLARQQMEFVAAVSHELRTPLAVICSAGENLADGVVADSQQVKRYGVLVETEGRRLADMVERVMEFAGITAGTMRIAHAEVDLAQVIADAIGGVSADARERHVRIEVHQANDGRATVVGDAEALRSAVQNLIGNAVKYSPAGATVEVSTDRQAGAIRLRVIDRGLGIDAADLPHVFKPFFRGRRALAAEVRGSGVGLSVVRHVVEAHHGRIHVESRPGQGTTVTLEMPVAEAAGEARRPAGAPS